MEPLKSMFNNRRRKKRLLLQNSSESDVDVDENRSNCSSEIENLPEASEGSTDIHERVTANTRSHMDRLFQNEIDTDLPYHSDTSIDVDDSLSVLCTPEITNDCSLEDGEELFSLQYDLKSPYLNKMEDAIADQLGRSDLNLMETDTNPPASEAHRKNQKCVDDSALLTRINVQVNEMSDSHFEPLENSRQRDSDFELPQNANVPESIPSIRRRTMRRNFEANNDETSNSSCSNRKYRSNDKRKKLYHLSHSNDTACPLRSSKVNKEIRKILNSDRFSSSDEIVEVTETVVMSPLCSESEMSTVSANGAIRGQNLECKKPDESYTSEYENKSSNEDNTYFVKNKPKRVSKRPMEENSTFISSTEDEQTASTEESVELFVSTPRRNKFQKQNKNADDDVTPKMKTRTHRRSKSSVKKLFDLEGPGSIQRTPKTTKLSSQILRSPPVNVNSLTPTMAARRTPHRTPTTPKDHARVALSLFSAPESLPCRGKEFKRIYEFLRDKINSRTSGFLCINGVPGTGKTATVERVVKKLSKEYKNEKNKFEVVEINGKQLIRPQEVYRQIWKQLTGRLTTANSAQKLLNERFELKKSKRQFPLIMIIDEFDCLMNKNVDVRVIYQIVEWQIQDNSRLTIVAIANTLDFFDKKKLFSRMKFDAISFSAYTYRELQMIVSDRLKGNGIFAPEAVEFVARKVASISGDARRALNICKLILDLVPEGQESDFVITIDHAAKVLLKIFNDPLIAVIRNCTRLEKILLRAIRDELSRTGLPNCTLYDGVWQQLKAICTLEDVTRVCYMTACILIQQLANLGLLKVDEECSVSLHTKISLCVESDVIRMALNASE